MRGRALSVSMLGMLASTWNLAHHPREPGRGTVRCLRGGHYENARVHDALIARGLLCESVRNRYTRVTAAGMRVLGVTARRFRPVDDYPEWPATAAERKKRDRAVRLANTRFRAVCKAARA